MFAKAQVDLPPPAPSQRQIFQIYSGMCMCDRIDAESFLRVARSQLSGLICGAMPSPLDADEESALFDRFEGLYTRALHTFNPANAPTSPVLADLDRRGHGYGLAAMWDIVTVNTPFIPSLCPGIVFLFFIPRSQHHDDIQPSPPTHNHDSPSHGIKVCAD